MNPISRDETVLREVRRHWFLFFLESLPFLLLVFAPFVLAGFLGAATSFFENSTLLAVFGLGLLTWLLFLWIAFFVVWTNYYLDVLIITNRRVIDIEQFYLFSREIAECRLERIQDVTAEVHGLLPTLLRFGNLHIQTAGMEKEFVVRHVPHPERVKDAIFQAIEEHARFANIREQHS
jgi:hypothetical protein